MYTHEATFYLAEGDAARHISTVLWIYRKAVINRKMEGAPGGLIESQCYWKSGIFEASHHANSHSTSKVSHSSVKERISGIYRHAVPHLPPYCLYSQKPRSSPKNISPLFPTSFPHKHPQAFHSALRSRFHLYGQYLLAIVCHEIYLGNGVLGLPLPIV